MDTRIRLLLRNIFLVALPMLSPIILLGVFSISIIQTELNNDLREKNIQILQQTTKAVDSVFSPAEIIGADLDTNARDQQMLKSMLNKQRSLSYSRDEYNAISYFFNILNSQRSANPYIHSIYIYVNNPYKNFFTSSNLITNSEKLLDETWWSNYDDPRNEQIRYTQQRIIEDYAQYDSGIVPCITISRIIKNRYAITNKMGAVVVNFRKLMIDQLLREYLSTPRSALVMVDVNGRILAGASNIDEITEENIAGMLSLSGNITELTLHNKKYICLSDQSELYGISLISLIPNKDYYKPTTDLLTITAILLLLSLIIGSIVSYYIARRNYQNMNIIVTTIKAAERGEPLPILLSRPKNEYEYLLQNMVNIFVRQNELQAQIAENKYELRSMEISMLQDQINPHFLHNTLRTIFWKTVGLTAGPNEASKMIEYLSDILYYVLSVQSHQVTLMQEIKHAESYLNIQRIRHSGKFLVIWDYDGELQNAVVIKLFLQALLENSILHGIAPGKRQRYAIKISVWRAGSQLHVRVIDNGVGMDKDRLKEVRESLDVCKESSRHIGLINVKKRLLLLHGDENVGFFINSKKDLGTSVYMYFPYVEQEEDDAEQIMQ